MLTPLHRLLLAVLGAFFVVLPAAPSASAVGLARLYAGPITASSNCNPDGAGAVPVTQAGAVTDFCFAFRMAPEPATGDHLAATSIESPPGVLANVDSVDQCAPADFRADADTPANCSTSTQVGTAYAEVRVNVAGLDVPVAVPGRVFNLKHTTDEGGLLGIQLDASLLGLSLPKSKVVVHFALRAAPDVGLRATSAGYPRSFKVPGLGTLPLAVDTFGFRFWGSRLDHPTMRASFTRLGSSCGQAVTSLAALSYAGARSSLTSTYESAGCERLEMAQRTTITVSDPRADRPTEATVQLDKLAAPAPDELEAANPAAARIVLPRGIMLGAQVASGGLQLCSQDAFAWTSNAAPSCPAASQVGTVRLVSPNAAIPYTGAVYLGEQPARGELPRLLISADQGGTAPDAPRVKLRGRLSIDASGALVAELADIPDLPFSQLTMVLRGGDDAVLTTAPACGTSTGSSTLVPPSPQTPPADSPLSLTIDQDCEPLEFAPTMTVAFADTQAGAEGRPTITLERSDRSGRLAAASVHLPPGLLASLRGIPECDLAAASGCSADSRIGTVTVSSGVGPVPFTTPSGGMYLTTRPAGAVAGVAVIAPVRIGPVDLGTMVVPGRIDLRTSDNGLDLAIDIPLVHLGLPLNLRTMRVALDREQFTRNPTTCSPLALTGELMSDAQSVGPISAPVQSTGCDRIAFAPSAQVRVSPGLRVGSSPGLDVTIASPPGVQAGLRRAVVTLPPGFAADLTKLGRACSGAEFAAGSCPDSAVTGTIDGRLGILDDPLAGRLLLVRVPGQTLPGIGLEFSGRFSTRVLGRTSVAKSGQVIVDLDGLPDAPIETLTIHLEAGDRSALKLSDLYCKDPKLAVFSFSLMAQSGAAVTPTAPLTCNGSSLLATDAKHTASVKAKLTGRRTASRRGLEVSAVAVAGARLAAIRVALPRELRIVRRNGTISANGGTVLASGSRTIRAAFSGGRPRTTRVRVRQGTVERARAGASRRVRLDVTLRYTDGAVEHRSVRVQ